MPRRNSHVADRRRAQPKEPKVLDLYHAGPSANSLKALLPLKEKQLDFTSHFVNLHNFEQHEPWFVKINPTGQVPVLVHDGKVITESTVINEYVDEVFPEVSLRPQDPYGRAQMRIWTKFVDEYFCPALSFLGWHAMIKNVVKDLSKEEFEAKIARIPLKEQQDKWRESAAQVWTDEQLGDWRRRVRTSIQRMEKGMQGPWMLGAQLTLADVSLFSMLIGMPQRYADIVNEKDSPRVVDWYTRMMERPSVKSALTLPRPAVRRSA
jgi:glutathione S-transferase